MLNVNCSIKKKKSAYITKRRQTDNSYQMPPDRQKQDPAYVLTKGIEPKSAQALDPAAN